MIRLYRALLHLYPASFRHEYGEEMAAAFTEAHAARTPLGRVGLLLRTAGEDIPNAIAVHWSQLLQDLRYTVRALNRSRGFAFTAIVVTALGVGANTAAFSVADFVLFRPLPYADSDRLVRLCEGPRTGGGWGCNNQLSPANYRDFKAMSASFEALGVFAGETVNLVGAGEPRRLGGNSVTSEVLPLLGVSPVLGRVFRPGAESEGDASAIILSHQLWQSQFGGDRGVLGRTVSLNGAPYTIIGVMPAGFDFPSREAQFWTQLRLQPEDFQDREDSYLDGIGRLNGGVSFDQARTELVGISERLGRDHPDTNKDTGISFFRLRDDMSPRFRTMLLALSGASVCLLLLACANLANLLLARATARRREFAVRAALGAGKERLARQMLTESVALALIGGAAGVLVAALSVPLFSSLVPPTLPIEIQPTLDLRVLVLAALFTGLTGLGIGLLPALRAGGRTGFAALREGSRAGGGSRHRLRQVLVTVEITMTVILLITSGLLIRAVWRVQSVDPGFRSENVLALKTELPTPKYDTALRRVQFYDRVLTEVRRLPGVQSASYITGLPISMYGGMTKIQIPGRPVVRDDSNYASHRFITPQFFNTMGIPLRAGRDVEDSDTVDRLWVAVVSESFVRQYWPGQNPIGQTFLHLGKPRTVVGVVGDIKFRGLERTSEPQIYLPAPQVTQGMIGALYNPKELVVRHAGEGAGLVAAIREIVRDADPEQPISDIRTLDDVLAGQTAPRRGQLTVLSALAVIALVLSGVGIHGLLAYTVSQRSHEIGVRLALGAERSSVARMILSDGLRLAVIGIVLGIAGAYGAARGMSALLAGVEPSDPATIAAALGLALTMTLVGSLLPAFRAARVPLMSVMKSE